MALRSIQFLASIFFASICMSRQMASLVSLIAGKTKLPCPHCGEHTINVGDADYFIPTISNRKCAKCGGAYHRAHSKGIALLCFFVGILLLIWSLIPEPWCFLFFPIECLLCLIIGVITYKPVKKTEKMPRH